MGGAPIYATHEPGGRDLPHRALYQVFLDVRDAAAHILDNTTLADLISGQRPRSTRGRRITKKEKRSVLPMVVGDQKKNS